MEGEGKGLAIGIDLGTTYSCVAVWLSQHERLEIITNDQGNRTTPSYVSFTDKERLIGEAAKNQAAMNPSNTVFGKFFIFYLLYDLAFVSKFHTQLVVDLAIFLYTSFDLCDVYAFILVILG